MGDLAREAGLSPYHFLRTFERITGVTPHQYVLRARLREAAIRLVAEPGNVLDIALDCGFGDVSNFNRAFRTEFGVSPRAYRQGAALFRAHLVDARARLLQSESFQHRLQAGLRPLTVGMQAGRTSPLVSFQH